MTGIYLIGTHHFDLDGSRKLEEALNKIDPDIVLVEGVEAQTHARERYQLFLSQTMLQEGITKDLYDVIMENERITGYEVEVVSKFCKDGRQFLYLNDQIPVSSRAADRSMARDYVKQLIQGRITVNMFRRGMEAEQEDIRRLYSDLKAVVGTPDEVSFSNRFKTYYQEIGDRDKQMENTSRPIVNINPDKTIATITGFNHVILDPREISFYSRMRDLNPERLFLYN